jgi:hypothetical protein
MSEDATTLMANYDLYTELDLDKDMPPAEIAALLDGKIDDFRSRGYPEHSPEVDQLSTARSILGDPYKRDVYESALYGGDDTVVDVVWLHNLADTTFPPTPEAAAADSPSTAETRQTPVSDLAGSADAAGVAGTAGADGAHSADDRTSGGLHTAPDETAETDETADKNTSDGEDRADAAADASPWSPTGGPTAHNAYGPGPYGGSFGQPGQPGRSGQPGQPGLNQAPNYGQPGTPSAAAASMNLSVAGRTRSESKTYLVCLAIMVLGMIYPLIVLFTGDNDSDGVYSILKATMFAIAHAVAWVGIAEVIWGVRRIAYPAHDDDK